MSLNNHSGHSSRDSHIPAFGSCSAPTARLPTLFMRGRLRQRGQALVSRRRIHCGPRKFSYRVKHTDRASRIQRLRGVKPKERNRMACSSAGHAPAARAQPLQWPCQSLQIACQIPVLKQHVDSMLWRYETGGCHHRCCGSGTSLYQSHDTREWCPGLHADRMMPTLVASNTRGFQPGPAST